MPKASIEQLAAFLAVAEAGSFTGAATRLGLTTNAVSLRVQGLENSLETRLFVRTTRSVTPTSEALVFLERVQGILGDLEAAEEAVAPATKALRGTVRIGIPSSVATGNFLGMLRPLLEREDGLVVQIRVANQPINLAAEGLDIGLSVGQPPPSGYVGKPLGRVRWVLAASPDYLKRRGRPRKPEDLPAHDCLRLLASPPQTEWTLLDRHGVSISVPVRGPFEADDSRTLGDAAYAGLGIGLRPLSEVDEATRQGRLERVLPNYTFEAFAVFALLPKGRLRLARVSACLEALAAAVRAIS